VSLWQLTIQRSPALKSARAEMCALSLRSGSDHLFVQAQTNTPSYPTSTREAKPEVGQ
jgi:hypothetical protein